MTLVKSIALSFTIWILTALLNAVMAGTWLAFFSNEYNNSASVFFLVFLFTLVFSCPGMVAFWIVLIINWKEPLLFRYLLKAGFIISAASSSLVYILPLDDIKGQYFFLSAFIVIAAIGSIMLHHRTVKNILPVKINSDHKRIIAEL